MDKPAAMPDNGPMIKLNRASARRSRQLDTGAPASCRAAARAGRRVDSGSRPPTGHDFPDKPKTATDERKNGHAVLVVEQDGKNGADQGAGSRETTNSRSDRRDEHAGGSTTGTNDENQHWEIRPRHPERRHSPASIPAAAPPPIPRIVIKLPDLRVRSFSGSRSSLDISVVRSGGVAMAVTIGVIIGGLSGWRSTARYVRGCRRPR